MILALLAAAAVVAYAAVCLRQASRAVDRIIAEESRRRPRINDQAAADHAEARGGE